MFAFNTFLKELEKITIPKDTKRIKDDKLPQEHKELAALVKESYNNLLNRKPPTNEYFYFPNVSTNELGVWTKGNKLIIAIKGTSSAGDLLTDLRLATSSFEKEDIIEMIEEVKSIMKNFPGHIPIITGHSLGGTKAIFISRFTGYKAVVFNSFIPTLDKLFKDTLDNSFNTIKYTVFGDGLSNKILNRKTTPNVILIQRPGITGPQKHTINNFV